MQFVDGKRVYSKRNKGIEAKIVTECGLKYSDYCIRRAVDFEELLELCVKFSEKIIGIRLL